MMQDRTFRVLQQLMGELAGVDELSPFLTSVDPNDAFVRRETRCTIKRDWLDAILDKLPYVFAAVEEQRQFLRSHRQIVRIDQAKAISSESVRHLAQHSQFIKRIAADGSVQPEQILVEERKESYAIYENRFLHTLAVLLQRFVERRYLAMRALCHSCTLQTKIGRELHLKEGKCRAALQIDNDIPLFESADEMISAPFDEINNLRRQIELLLQAPLMRMLRNSPPVASPIVRTNVIKSNINFRKALALFEFLEQYQDDGFSVETNDVDCSADSELRRMSLALLWLAQDAITHWSQPEQWEHRMQAYCEENERLEKERLLQEREKEEKTLASVAAAREEEIALRNAVAARMEQVINQLRAEINQITAMYESRLLEARNQVSATIEQMTREQRTHAEELLAHRNAIHELNTVWEAKIASIQERSAQELAEAKCGWEVRENKMRLTHRQTLERQRVLAEEQLRQLHTKAELNLEKQRKQMKAELHRTRQKYLKQL